jgi:hypothetical protein
MKKQTMKNGGKVEGGVDGVSFTRALTNIGFVNEFLYGSDRVDIWQHTAYTAYGNHPVLSTKQTKIGIFKQCACQIQPNRRRQAAKNRTHIHCISKYESW